MDSSFLSFSPPKTWKDRAVGLALLSGLALVVLTVLLTTVVGAVTLVQALSRGSVAAEPQQPTKGQAMYYLYDVQNVTVVDGDTIKADVDLGFDLTYHADVRVLGVDTPEKRIVAQRAAAAKAMQFVAKWFEANKGKVVLKSQEWDKYGGRVLGDFYVGDGKGQSLGQLLIAKGYGKAYQGEKKTPWTAAQLKAIEALP